jgi:hypothetical protein
MGDIKYGDEHIIEDDAKLTEALASTSEKEVIKALNTILSVLVYSTNLDSRQSLAPRLQPDAAEEDNLRK